MAGRKKKRRATKPLKPRVVALKSGPHNGEGRPDLQIEDPINGDMIGGQVAAMRMAMRYRHTVYPWARRQGKTTFRQFLLQNEATITSGEYYAGIVFPDHTTAAKIANVFRESWGDMVKAAKINDKDQDRWIELHPMLPPEGEPPPTWFTPSLAAKWTRCLGGECNTRFKVYFWGGAHPYYEKIQGFPHHFNRVDWDETQQIHPLAYGPVRPMIRDVRGHECFSGTPWVTGIGNFKFESWWRTAGEPDEPHWFRMRIPDGTNPFVPPVADDELRSMTRQEIRQTMYAEFLTGEGALFSNLDAVISILPLPKNAPSLKWIRELRAIHAMPSVEWWIADALPTRGHVIAASIDWARSPTGDYSVLSVFDLSTAQQIALVRWRGENFTSQLELVLAIKDHYGAAELHSDANGMGETMSDFMRARHAAGFVGHKFGKNKADYVRRAQILFTDDDVRLINCSPQFEEFKQFAAHESIGIGSEKTIKYAAPQGENDDIVAAFLHLAPTISTVGRREVVIADAPPAPTFDREGRTTLSQLFPEHERPHFADDATEEFSWTDVIA